MGRYGINVDNAIGVKVTDLRRFARQIERSHDIALALWDSGVHEARILATLLDDPVYVDEKQMERWAAQFDSWDIVDLVCNNLFRKTRLAHEKAFEWAERDEEYVKRAGFALMATLAVHDKRAGNGFFIKCLDRVKRESYDNRNFVKKAVSWALRQIGKRNPSLMEKALTAASKIKAQNTGSARWIASDAVRELERVRQQRGW